MSLKSIDKLANYNNKKSLANKFRNKRFAFFEKQLQKVISNKPLTILDIGGTDSYWINRGYHEKKDIVITILNLSKGSSKYPNLIYTKGDACDLSEFRDNEFNIVYSNSVIEHLYTAENQKLMADEVRRVGENYYIQTPNKFFIIEPHYLLPLFQFLPRKVKVFILSKTILSRGRKRTIENAENSVNEIKLLSISSMKKLFPDGDVYKEKFLFMNKSITSFLFKKNM